MAIRELARALDTPSGTLRDNIQRLLIHRGDRAAAPVLVTVAQNSAWPETRMQALCALDGLGALTPELLVPRGPDRSASGRPAPGDPPE